MPGVLDGGALSAMGDQSVANAVGMAERNSGNVLLQATERGGVIAPWFVGLPRPSP